MCVCVCVDICRSLPMSGLLIKVNRTTIRLYSSCHGNCEDDPVGLVTVVTGVHGMLGDSFHYPQSSESLYFSNLWQGQESVYQPVQLPRLCMLRRLSSHRRTVYLRAAMGPPILTLRVCVTGPSSVSSLV